MVDKFMYIPSFDTQNYLVCRLNLVIETLGNSNLLTTYYKFTKSLKLLCKRLRIPYYKTFGTSAINIKVHFKIN